MQFGWLALLGIPGFFATKKANKNLPKKNRTSLERSISTAAGDVKSTLESMRDIPSAYWLDNKGSSASGELSKKSDGNELFSIGSMELADFMKMNG